jgi:hypothetical protein
VARHSRLALCISLCVPLFICATPGDAGAEVPCAGEGPPILEGEHGYLPPSMKAAVPTALVTLAGLPWQGREASAASGDPVAGGRVRLERARLGLCGHFEKLAYRLVYEPWDAAERGRADARSWGRFTDAQVAWAPRSWLVVAVGLGKVPSGRGREQPIGALAVPVLPGLTTALAPDRRLGVMVDAEVGVGRLAVGIYDATRNFNFDGFEGLLLVGRLELPLLGPVSRRNWPEAGAWTDRKRVIFGGTGQYRLSRGGGTGYLVGGDAGFAWRRVYVGAEVLYARRWPSERDPTKVLPRAIGGWAEAVVQIWRPYLMVALRGEYLDGNLDPVGGFVGLTPAVTLALPGPLVQLQAMYSHKFHFAGRRADDVALITVTLER